MTRFRFVHAADLHLDTPFEGVGRVAPDVAAALRDASLEAWDALVELTLREEAAFLLLAGDIYDGPDRGVRAQLRFRRGLEQLAERGIRTFIVHGNHDPLGGWSAIRRWPEGVTVFGSQEVEAAPVEREGTRLATIHGLSYGKREVTENLALRFGGEAPGRRPGREGGGAREGRRDREARGLQIGLLHCNVGAIGEHANYSPCTLDDLRRAGLDYWALGHAHRREVLQAGAPWVVYPGCLQGRSPAPGELGAKGAVVVEVEEGAVRDVRFAPCDRVRFAALALDAGGCEDLPSLQLALAARAEALRAEHEGRGLLLRATLTGRGPVHADLRRVGAREAVLDEIRRAAADSAPLLWWETIADETGPLVDLAAARERGDFPAELLRYMDRLAAEPATFARFASERMAALAKAGLPPEVVAAGAEPRALLAEAGALAFDLLEGKGPA